MPTLTTLNGSSSEYDPRSFDVLSAANSAARLRSRGPIIHRGRFQNGDHCGWRQHYAYATTRTPIGTTTQQSFNSSHSLMLSTSEQTYNAADSANVAGTYLNLTRAAPSGLVSLSFWYGLAGDGSQTEWKFPWSAFGFGIDTQMGDDSWRSFPKIQMEDNGTASPMWRTIGTSATTDIPGSGGVFPGGNEGKLNWGYVRFTWDTTNRRFIELQSQDRIFDLSAVDTTVASDTILNTGSTNDFSYGLNFGIWLNRSTLNPTFTNNRMHIAETLVTVNDKAA